MKLRRLYHSTDSTYISTDGRVKIKKVFSRQTGRPTETLWELNIDGVYVSRNCFDTKKEAVEEARKLLKEKGA